jgi:acetolactate synthase I/III small subunit
MVDNPPPTAGSDATDVCHLIRDKPSETPREECHLIRDKPSGPRRGDCHVLSDKPAGGGAVRTGGGGTGRSAAGEPGCETAATAVIELRVRNHPGAMSHITGLFARRAFNLEAIVCAPCGDDAGATSRMLLLVAADARLEQVERQLAKLHDVLEVRLRADLDREFFVRAVEGVPPRDALAVPL